MKKLFTAQLLPQFSILLFLTSIIFTFNSCRKADKIDNLQSPEIIVSNNIENRFFNAHSSADPMVQNITAYIKRKNDSLKFVEKTVGQIGYPRWDKAKVISNLGNIQGRGNAGDSATITYIPFVRDSEEFVNATMTISASAEDTSFSYLCDWQYTQKNFTFDTSIADNAFRYFLFFALQDNNVFGHTRFQILDNDILQSAIDTTINKDKQYVLDLLIDEGNLTEAHAPQPHSSCLIVYDMINIGYSVTYHTVGSICVIDSYYHPDFPLGGGGGTGGGSGNGTPDECDPEPIVGNRTEIAYTCEPGWEQLPIDDEHIFYDYAVPPFIWTFSNDDGTTFIDPDPLTQPDFQFDLSDDYETKYPRFTNMVENLKTFVKENSKVLNALQKFSGFSKQQILNHLTYGQGPKIKVEEMRGRFGYYNKNNGNNTLHIRASYVRGLEAAFLQSTQECTAFFLAVTILHEYVHLGTSHNNISEGVYDFGTGFERDAFNVIIDSDNVGTVSIKYSEYF